MCLKCVQGCVGVHCGGGSCFDSWSGEGEGGKPSLALSRCACVSSTRKSASPKKWRAGVSFFSDFLSVS